MNKRRLLQEGILDLQDDKQYTSREVYEWIATVLTYINRQIDGEFALAYVRRGNWMLRYDEEKAVKKRARQKADKEIEATADYIQQLTGKRPDWG